MGVLGVITQKVFRISFQQIWLVLNFAPSKFGAEPLRKTRAAVHAPTGPRSRPEVDLPEFCQAMLALVEQFGIQNPGCDPHTRPSSSFSPILLLLVPGDRHVSGP